MLTYFFSMPLLKHLSLNTIAKNTHRVVVWYMGKYEYCAQNKCIKIFVAVFLSNKGDQSL